MASSTDAVEMSGSAPANVKVPVVPLAMAMIVAVLLGAGAVGGVMVWLAKAGKLGGTAAPVKVEAAVVAPKTHALTLEPILVNLADEGGRAYLRVALTVRVADEELKKGEKPKEEKPEKGAKGPGDAEAAVRDTVLGVLGRESSDTLLEADGKEALKVKLRSALLAHNPDLKVTDVFFTEFLVQR